MVEPDSGEPDLAFSHLASEAYRCLPNTQLAGGTTHWLLAQLGRPVVRDLELRKRDRVEIECGQIVALQCRHIAVTNWCLLGHWMAHLRFYVQPQHQLMTQIQLCPFGCWLMWWLRCLIGCCFGGSDSLCWPHRESNTLDVFDLLWF